jgi:hypothetical protein
MTKTGTGKDFNPTVTTLFNAPKWGSKAFNGEAGAAFLSAPIDDKGFEALKALKPGGKLLARKSPKLDKNGSEYFFLEVIEPMEQSI